MLYYWFSQFSAVVSQPIFAITEMTDVTLLTALLLGLVGALAPCQISANIGAIIYFGNRQVQQKLALSEVVLYLLGKVAVFAVFGLLFWLIGRNISAQSIPLFVWARKLVGPLLVVMGLFMLGWVRLPGSVGLKWSASLKQQAKRLGGKTGAFFLGVSFSLGFCPTMFWLFFGLLMPMALNSRAGALLPPVFALGTAVPFLLFLGLSYGFGIDTYVKKAKVMGRNVQGLAGAVFILLGILDTLTYWTINI